MKSGALFFLLLIIFVIIIARKRGLDTPSEHFTHTHKMASRTDEEKSKISQNDEFRNNMDHEFGRGKYAENRRLARETGKSGSPRWMESFSKVDMFGKPTVFSSDFMERK